MKDIPLPMKIIASLMEGPKTIKALSLEMGLTTNAIQVRIKRLERCKLIIVTVTEKKRYTYSYNPKGWQYIQTQLGAA